MKHCGIVEGFYWREEHSIDGRYGEFDREKRLRLLEFMATKGLNVYVYEPKVLREENVARVHNPDLLGDSEYWTAAFRVASDHAIDFIWGLGPGKYEEWRDHTTGLCSVIDLVLGLGAAGFALLFDDVEGSETDFEMKQQADLANELWGRYPGKIFGLCSGTYCGTRRELEERLETLDQHLATEVAVVFTGTEVWPPSITRGDMPRFSSGRKCIVWDNWMASDTSDPTRLKLVPPRRREKGLWSEVEAYWLNANFPVERIIHMVSAVGEMRGNGGSFTRQEEPRVIRTMAHDWASFLGVDEEPIFKMLAQAAGLPSENLRRDEVESVARRWPALEPVMMLVVDR